MRNQVAIRMSGVAKMYKVFPSRMQNFLDAIGLPPVLSTGRKRYKEFWALRGIDLELPAGSRVGILGRNGAGKSTLLKLITGNIPVTEGRIEVHGTIQALLEAGAGFHPEFTGYENIHASLTFQGVTSAQMKAAVEDIVAFTELGDFLTQPYRTYSAGMQARLAFATATAVSPEILIIDEMLGAGDAYFLSKSADRIRQLVMGGATVLLVSHSVDQIVKLCDQAIWIERGRVACRGTSLEVVKEYERYIRYLDNERLQAKNKLVCETRSHAVQVNAADEKVEFRFAVPRGLECDISKVVLVGEDSEQAMVHVGDAQDGDTSQRAYVDLGGEHWSEPRVQEGVYFRRLAHPTASLSFGSVICRVFHPSTAELYRCRVTYKAHGTGLVSLIIFWKGVIRGRYDLPLHESSWGVHELALPVLEMSDSSAKETFAAQDSLVQSDGRSISRWPGDGQLRIESVHLLNEEEKEQAVFVVESRMVVRLNFTARGAGTYDIIPVAVLFRLDGVLVSTHIGKPESLQLNEGEKKTLSLDYGHVMLGNGNYVFSVALYRKLSSLDVSEVYDLLDRSYEFCVVGNPPLENGLIRHQTTWTLL